MNEKLRIDIVANNATAGGLKDADGAVKRSAQQMRADFRAEGGIMGGISDIFRGNLETGVRQIVRGLKLIPESAREAVVSLGGIATALTAGWQAGKWLDGKFGLSDKISSMFVAPRDDLVSAYRAAKGIKEELEKAAAVQFGHVTKLVGINEKVSQSENATATAQAKANIDVATANAEVGMLGAGNADQRAALKGQAEIDKAMAEVAGLEKERAILLESKIRYEEQLAAGKNNPALLGKTAAEREKAISELNAGRSGAMLGAEAIQPKITAALAQVIQKRADLNSAESDKATKRQEDLAAADVAHQSEIEKAAAKSATNWAEQDREDALAEIATKRAALDKQISTGEKTAEDMRHAVEDPAWGRTQEQDAKAKKKASDQFDRLVVSAARAEMSGGTMHASSRARQALSAYRAELEVGKAKAARDALEEQALQAQIDASWTLDSIESKLDKNLQMIGGPAS